MDNSADAFPAPVSDRRLKPRRKCNYPIVVWGHSRIGMQFMEEGIVTNLCKGGIYVVLNKPIPDCAEVSMRIALSVTRILEFGSSKIATTGTVVRKETRPDGTFGVAIQYQNYRTL